MKKKKQQFTVERIIPEKGGKLYRGTAWNLFLSVCLILGSLSVLYAEWEEYLSLSAMGIFLAAVTLICCVLTQRSRKKQWPVICYYAGPWVLMLILTGFHGYWLGARSWLNMILMHWNELHDGGVGLFQIEAETTAMQAFSLAMIVLIVQLSWWMANGRRVIVGIIYSVAWIQTALASGVFQPYMGMFCLIGLTGMFMAVQGGYITKRNLFSFLTVIAIIVAGTFLVTQNELEGVTQAREQGKEKIHTWRYGEDTLPEGDLREAAKLQKNTDEMLRVRTGQQKMLYLRGFVGESYQDGVWHELPAYAYGDSNTGIMKWLQQQGFDPMTQVAQYYSLGSDENRPQENLLNISVTDACRYYIYMPTTMENLNGAKFKEKRFARITSTGLKGADNYYGIELSGSRPAELTVAEDWVSNPATDEQQKYCEAEAVYRNFVYENYTQTDKSIASLMNKLFWKDYEPESDGIYSALTQVRTVLSQTVRYVDEPKAAPEGSAPIEWFLTESKEGNAVLYASAAVEALRTYGIPARYIEGYFLPENQAASGGEISLTGENAHAWVEIYFDGIGWLPTDVTPGYYFDAVSLQQMVSMPDTVQKNAALNDNGYDTNVVNNGGKQNTKAQDVLKEVLNVAAICLGIVALIVVILTILFLIVEILRFAAAYMLRKRESQFSDMERIKYKTRKIYHLLAIWGIDASLGWNMEDTDQQITDRFADIRPGEYRRVCVLLEKAEYGGLALQSFEERTIDVFLEKITAVDRSVDWKIRFKLHYELFYNLKSC